MNISGIDTKNPKLITGDGKDCFLKEQSHEKIDEIRPCGVGLGPKLRTATS
jgi:hypothetical protein